APLAQLVDAGVHGDAIDPREEGSIAIEPSEPPVNAQKGFLARIPRVLGVAEDAERDTVDAPLVARNERAKCAAIAFFRGAHQMQVRVAFFHAGMRLQARCRRVASCKWSKRRV